jgi:hypothetical protein
MQKKSYLKPLEALLRKEKTFGHRQHLDLAWRYLHLTDGVTAETWMREAIKHVALKHGASDKYNETQTIAWIRLIGTHVRVRDAVNFDEFVAQNADLLNTGLLEHFYSHEVLHSPLARLHWVEPDLAPLP